MNRRHLKITLMCFLVLSTQLAAEQSSRIKDLVNIRGFRSNQLIGFGLVVGLAGSGDSKKALTTNAAVANMLTRLGMRTESSDVTSGNIAAVVTTAELTAFARIGDQVSVRVSTIGDSSSLAGGTLVMTQLRAGDGKVYAVAQGPVVVGQADGKGAKVLTVAQVPRGATVEREFQPTIAADGKLTLSLKEPDFTTNARIAKRVNQQFKGYFARSVDPVTVEVSIPKLFRDRVIEFVSALEGLTVAVDHKAVVVINERTGTVVMGDQVTIGPLTIAHGDLSIQVGEKGGSETQSLVGVKGSTVGQLVESLNALGIKPADLVGIFQAIQAAGALQAELKFM